MTGKQNKTGGGGGCDGGGNPRCRRPENGTLCWDGGVPSLKTAAEDVAGRENRVRR